MLTTKGRGHDTHLTVYVIRSPMQFRVHTQQSTYQSFLLSYSISALRVSRSPLIRFLNGKPYLRYPERKNRFQRLFAHHLLYLPAAVWCELALRAHCDRCSTTLGERPGLQYTVASRNQVPNRTLSARYSMDERLLLYSRAKYNAISSLDPAKTTVSMHTGT